MSHSERRIVSVTVASCGYIWPHYKLHHYVHLIINVFILVISAKMSANFFLSYNFSLFATFSLVDSSSERNLSFPIAILFAHVYA